MRGNCPNPGLCQPQVPTAAVRAPWQGRAGAETGVSQGETWAHLLSREPTLRLPKRKIKKSTLITARAIKARNSLNAHIDAAGTVSKINPVK